MKSREDNITESLVNKMQSALGEADVSPASPSWDAFQSYSDARSSAVRLKRAVLLSLMLSILLIGVVVYTLPSSDSIESTQSPIKADHATDSLERRERVIREPAQVSVETSEANQTNDSNETERYELPEYVKKAKSVSSRALLNKPGAQKVKPGSFVMRDAISLNQSSFANAYNLQESGKDDLTLTPQLISNIPYPLIDALDAGNISGLANPGAVEDSTYIKVKKPFTIKATAGIPIAFARTAIENWISVTFKNWTVGLEYERPLFGRFSVIGGLSFLHIDQRYDLRSPVEAQNTTVDFQRIRFNAFHIPIGIKYDFKEDRSGWYLSAGMSTYNFVRREDTFQYRWFGGGIRNINQTTTLKNGFSFSNTNLFSTADVAIGRHTNIGKLGVEWEAFGAFPVFKPSPGYSLAFTDLVTWGFNLKFAIWNNQ